MGLALVPEGRLLFDSLSVEENLMIGRSGRAGPWSLERIYALFPILAEKRRQRPATLSGGQQQMVAIGRALASNPAILLCDEISLGLSPRVTAEVYAALDRVRTEGISLVVVDQDVARVCEHANEVVCLFKGRISHHGPAEGVTAQNIKHAYFGVAE
jgi:branched-chain amino acid transport system ATP-binding protein